MKHIIPLFLALLLTACGGGGGGGGGGVGNPYLVRDVPYSTPTRIDTIQIAETPVAHNTTAGVFTADLTNTGKENVIVAGRSDTTYSKISVFGWNNGQLQNQTSQWFTGNSNVIVGTEPSVKFGDFLGNGKLGMYVAPSTDANWSRGYDGAVFINNGNSFSRTNFDLGAVWAHDSVIHDFNKDGKDDIFTADYGSNSSIAFSHGDGTFNVARNTGGSALQGSSAVAVADFMGNGGSQFIVTDSTSDPNTATRLLSWNVAGTNLSFSDIANLPKARFDLPKWASYNFGSGGLASHSVRALAFDFDNSGTPSAVIISRPSYTNGAWPEYSEVQFLKNTGGGAFVDVTDTTLIGYNTKAPASYNPKLLDINSDGLMDILLAGTSWTTANNMQVLIHTKEHKYVASYTSVFNAFEAQAQSLEAYRSSVVANSNITNVVVGPGNELYMVTVMDTFVNGVNAKAVYMSKIGAQTASPQATVASIRQAWPYLSAAQVNETLSRSTTQWLGFNVIDSAKALSPIGDLSLSKNSPMAISGYLSGVNLSKINNITMFDTVGRGFAVNVNLPTADVPNAWARYAENFGDDTRGAGPIKMEAVRLGNFKFASDSLNQAMSVGIVGIPVGKNTTMSTQYTQLPFSPFIQMSGSWGKVKAANILETSVTTQKDGWVGKAGIMYSNTLIEQGIVTNVSPITSVWTEAGYDWGKFKLFAGMLPKVVGGTASLSMPSGVDNSGNAVYNDSKANVTSVTTRYVRASYFSRINKWTSIGLSGLVTDTNQFGLYGDLRVRF